MRSFLMQPYPFSDNLRNKLLVCGGIGAFVTLFLALFEPFGFDELTTALKWKHAFFFGTVTFFISSFFQLLLPLLLPQLFREEAWRSWKEILYLLLTTITIGAGNYVLMLVLYPQTTTLSGFFRSQLVTLQVGIFPIVFIVFTKQIRLYRRFAAEAKEASDDIHKTAEEKETAPATQPVPKLCLRGDNQKEEVWLFPNDLLCIASADNYVKLLVKEEPVLKSMMLRSTLKKMEEQLQAYPAFFRCHRMYIVNLQLVEEVSGNAQGLKLHLPGFEEALPVSRSLTETVREKLHGLSHSPQNA